MARNKNGALFSALFCLAGLFISATILAQQEYKPATISVASGLSQSSVFCLTQDHDGFLWIGTQDGLNKYDGINFEIYRNEPFDSLSLPSGLISSLLADTRGRLWVGTENRGLCLFLPQQQHFKSFYSGVKKNTSLNSSVIHCIVEDAQHMVWVGTHHGLFRIREQEDGMLNPVFIFEQAFLSSPDSQQAPVYSILFTGRNRAFVSTSNGILDIQFEVAGSKEIRAKRMEIPMESKEPGAMSQAMAADADGNAWIASSSSLYFFELKTGKIKRLYSFSSGERITSILPATSGEMWLATSRSLYSISPEDVKRAPVQNPVVRLPLPKEKALNNGVMALWEDKLNQGLLWAGSDVNGLVKLNPVRKKFQSTNLSEITAAPIVFSILEDKPFLWLGTTDGLIRYDESKNQYRKFNYRTGDPGSLASNYVANLYRDPSGDLWAGTAMGLQKVMQARSDHPSFQSIGVNPERPKAAIRRMATDHAGNMLIALPKKVYRYEKKSGGFKELLDISRVPEGKFENVIISSVMEDAEGRYWVGTSGGLAFYTSLSSPPQWYAYDMHDTSGLRNNLVQSIRTDSHGSTWISTFNGFHKASVENGKLRFKTYTSKDGLANNTVYGYLEDPATGMLWLSTNGGLSRFNPMTAAFVNFDLQDGLQSNEFNANAFFCSAEGQLFFGGVNGYTSFFPSDIKTDTIPPHVLITGVFQSGGDRLIPQERKAGRTVVLPYNQNSLSLEFVALHYADPGKNKYAYKLEGLHSDWIHCGYTRQVNFSQLSPGTYVFRVTGSNSDGLYSTTGATLTLVIKPPFWQSPWFYLLLAALVSLGLIVLHRYRLHMKVMQMKEIEKIRQDTAADFHDELGHRLTTISWFSEVMKNKIRPEETELKGYLDKIIDTSSNLYHTMKDLVWAMDPKKDTVQDLYLQLKSFGEGIFDQTGIDFTVSPVPPTVKNQALPLMYKRHVLLILKEAMHNSFKHSQCTQAELKLFRENGSYSILFRDNGHGFDLKKSLQGNGLKNIRKRASLIHARAHIRSGEAGTALELTFHVPKNE